jgi:predicted metal-dependent phosphoesterase TrpH
MLVYGVNRDILARFDFANVRLPAQEVVTEIFRMGGVALPCHPGRPTVGLCAHYDTRGPLDGVIAVEALNGGSKKGEDDRVRALMEQYGYAGYGGSDSHLVSFVGTVATELDRDIRSMDDLVEELRAGRCHAVDFRRRAAAAAVGSDPGA